MNNDLIIDERQRDLGDFIVGRLLPFRKKRAVGPFVFIDHIGPTSVGPDHYIDVDQHPHIGLSTLTYLLEGEMEHRDSMGVVQRITAGDVGFMTAGKGVAHTERTPVDMRDGNSYPMHGYQVWVGIPKEREQMEPGFDFVETSELPRWKTGGVKFALAAGEAFGRKSPLQVHSKLYMLDLEFEQDVSLDLREELYGEIAIVITKGNISHRDERIGQGKMLVNVIEDSCKLEVESGSRLLVFGGEPFPEERFLMWNFASSNKEVLRQAKEDWEAKRFPKVPGDDTYIPYPSR